MADNVNFEHLADLCEGYSGDDITNVCRDAAMNGMRTLIAGKTPDQIRHAWPHLHLVSLQWCHLLVVK